MADPRRPPLGALLALCCLALLTVPASAAPLDRAAFAADLCGDGAAQVRGAEGLVQAGGDLPADDLAFAGGLLGALAERRLACPSEGALLLDRPGAPEGRDARTGAARPAAEALPADLVVDERLRAPALAEDWSAWAEAWRALDAGPLRELAQAGADAPHRLVLAGERTARRWRPQARPWWKGLLGGSGPGVAAVLGAL